MATHTSEIIPTFNFREAEALPVAERLRVCLARARRIVASNGYQAVVDAPCVPRSGASETELIGLELALGVPLPPEYRQFLSVCRYLKVHDGYEVGGFGHDGVGVTQRPWLSREHRPGVAYLVFADYGRYADGDHLMFDLTEPGRPVIAYLHGHGPLFEAYAPSFSLALWRLVREADDELRSTAAHT